MKSSYYLLLILPATVFSSPVNATKNIRVAVFDFQADGNINEQLGTKNVGKSIANVLANDLSGLAPLTVIGRRAIQQGLDQWKLDLVNPIAPTDAKKIGLSLDATTLVTGRILRTGTETIIAAKVVSAETGQTFGTMVKGDRSTPIFDLVSKLSTQIGESAFVQEGVESPTWSSAMIVGTQKSGSVFSHDEVAYIMAIDGKVIPDGAGKWNEKQPLLPGAHEIFVHYYNGTSAAAADFFFNAKPGASYEVSYERQADGNPKLWIRDRDSHQAVTSIVEAKMGEESRGPDFSQFYFFESGPFVISPQGYNSNSVRPPGKR